MDFGEPWKNEPAIAIPCAYSVTAATVERHKYN